MINTQQLLFVVILWSIWRARNACIWENKQANPVSTCLTASDLLQDYNWCCNALVSTPLSDHSMTWEKPPVDWLKCNVDGALFMNERKFGIRVCYRDSLGSFVQAHTMIFLSKSQPLNVKPPL
ncbi:ribonuclease H protein [Trifolium medium]|uniref:Ribonuclease H protein n=1 Tax=Trifolium medium TaxID=97028 RepID=A0A392MCP3_9FABA|nr:ribonuclease H protein [Trifolium medium]